MLRRHVRLAAAVILAAAPHLRAQAPARDSKDARRALEQAVDSIMRDALRIPIAGIAIAVTRGDALVLEKAYGVADRSRNAPATAQTVFEAGSITKQLTAAAILRLAEQKRLGLDDSIGVHLPALAERARGITIWHLLSHTSGLSRAWAVADLGAPSSPRVVVDSLAARAPEFAPGERYAYNNNGYILLGLIVERAAGTSYAEYVRTTFLQPLGLASTMPCSAVPAARRSTGYTHATRGPTSATVAPAHHATVTYSAGMLCSTAGDLARWQRALATGRVVSAESRQAMTTPAVLASGRPSRYGLGVEIGAVDGLRYLEHGGATPGFLGESAYLPDSAVGVTVLTNGVYAGSIVTRLVQGVARQALGLPQPRLADLPTSAADRARFAGTFDLGPVKLEVYEQGDHLRAQPPGQVAARLLHQGDGVFVAEHDPALRFRFQLAGERAGALVIEQGGRAMPPAKRSR
ncbi:MAG: serine hydrolase domain-containing protein [Gemmatirosa sp.]